MHSKIAVLMIMALSVGCGSSAPPWVDASCIGRDQAATPHDKTVGELFCVHLGIVGGFAGANPEARVTGSSIARVEVYVTDDSDGECCDQAETKYERYEVKSVGESKLAVYSRPAMNQPSFELTIRGK